MLILWMAVAYVSGGVPYSWLIGRYRFGVDIRDFGDGNPGATNVKRASGSTRWFIIAMLLDGFKGLIPVSIAHWVVGLHDFDIALVALAAIAGHAFSPFLRLQGGKAIAITWGVWCALTIWEAPTIMGLLLLYWFLSVKESDWAVVLMMLSFLVYLCLTFYSPSLHFRNGSIAPLVLWAGNFIILLYRHRASLSQPPTIKRWLPFLPKDTSNSQTQTAAVNIA